MNKQFSYKTMICTALVMISGTIHTMMLQSEPLKFKMAGDSSYLKVYRNCEIAGFVAGCTQQAYIAYQGFFAEHPVAGGTGIMAGWGLSVFFSYALRKYKQDVIVGLHTWQDDAIHVVFDHMHQPPPLSFDKEPGREEKAAAFIAKYKQMQRGEIPLEADVVAAHNTVLRRAIAAKSFAQGFMQGAALGPLPTLFVLHMLGYK
jgi:hypothetical protein